MPPTEDHSWDRRRFLTSVAGAFLAGRATVVVDRAAGQARAAAPFADSDPSETLRLFPQGVASGDPRPDGVLLWTRVAHDDDIDVRFQVAEDPRFEQLSHEGTVRATSASDFTVRVRLKGLAPHRRYWYRFSAAGVSSPVGRTTTAPLPEADVPLRIAFASCQDYQGRWYHAWQALVERAEEIDFVLFLGDYIYEYERYPGLQEPQPGRAIELPDGLVIDEKRGVVAAQSLEDYRQLYRVTRSDPNLQRIHQLCPFVIIWDDHEHANDAWQDHAVDFNGRRGDEQDTARREAATQAWFEHLPVDVRYDPRRGFPDDITVWRTLRWGRHVELFLTDSRYYRDDHLIPEGPADPAVGKIMPFSPLGSRTFCIKHEFDRRQRQARPTMLGQQQREWLIERLQTSDATWKVWASALMVGQMVLDLRSENDLPKGFQHAYYFKTDQWDGFADERRQILDAMSSVENLVVLSGDLHGFYVAELYPDFDDTSDARPVAAEFTVAGISSISLLEQIETVVRSQPLLTATGLGKLLDRFDPILLASSPHIRYADSRGYGAAIARFTSGQVEIEFLGISGVREPQWNGNCETRRFHVAAGDARVHPVPDTGLDA